MRLPRLTKASRRAPEPSRTPLGFQVLLWLLVGLVAAFGTLLLLWIAYDRPNLAKVNTSKGIEPKLLFDALKIAFSILAGIGGVVALVVAYRRQKVHESEDQRDSTRLFSERFAMASEQLGSDNAAIRLAGVYSLAALADDWEEQRQTCIDVLCAYLRMPHRNVNKHPDLPEKHHYDRGQQPWRSWLERQEEIAHDPHEEQQVRLTIQRVIRDHLQSSARVPWHGHNFDFSGAVFEGGSFDGAEFVDCSVIFDQCLFHGESWFSECNFIRSDISFTGAVIADRIGFEFSYIKDSTISMLATLSKSGYINFQGACLESGQINFTGDLSTGGGISFISAELEGGEINFSRLEMRGKDPSLAFSRATVNGTDIKIIGNTCKAGIIYFNGLQMKSGSITLKGGEPLPSKPFFIDGVELSMESVEIAGGTFTVADTLLRSGQWSIGNLRLIDGSLRLLNIHFTGGKFEITEPNIDNSPIEILGANFGDTMFNISGVTPRHLIVEPKPQCSKITNEVDDHQG